VNTVSESLRAIMDCMTGADGGVSFVKTRVMLEAMEARALSGDEAADAVCAVVHRFAKLIEVAQGVQP